MRTTLLVTCAVLAVFMVGCKSDQKSGKAIASLKDTRDDLVACSAAVDKTQAALKNIATASDIKAAHANLVAATKSLKAEAEDLSEQAAMMQEQGRLYIEKWKAEMDTVTDPDIKASAAERRDAVAKNFTGIRDSAQGARTSYQKYTNQLRDIDTALANDPTTAGAAMVDKSVKSAIAEGETLKKELATLTDKVNAVYSGMSTTRPAAAPAK